MLSTLKLDTNRSRLNGIIVAIGVNDARRQEFPVNYERQWKESYSKMIDLALKLSPAVSVLTILPVEDDMPLGTNYFETTMIDRLNILIRQVAHEKDVRLIDASKYFLNIKRNGHYTVDGVHPDANAYKLFSKELQIGMPSHCFSLPLEIMHRFGAILN